MRGFVVLVVVGGCVALAAGCTMPDAANLPVHLVPPYDSLPPPPPGDTFEPGKPVSLDARLQQAVAIGVVKWMKDPTSAQLSGMGGARNSRGTIVVCGQVKGRNSAGALVGPAPFVGVMMGTDKEPDFVVVGIGATSLETTTVASLCREAGVTHQT